MPASMAPRSTPRPVPCQGVREMGGQAGDARCSQGPIEPLMPALVGNAQRACQLKCVRVFLFVCFFILVFVSLAMK